SRDPRTFVRGTGFVLQVAGFILLFGGCCIGSLSGWIQPEQPQAAVTTGEWFKKSPPGFVLAAGETALTGAAGLALVAFGLGLQHERRGSGRGAVAATACLAGVWWTGLVLAVILSPAVGRILINLVFAIAFTVLFLLAGAANREFRLHPPPP